MKSLIIMRDVSDPYEGCTKKLHGPDWIYFAKGRSTWAEPDMGALRC
ncbi:MAG: hypothetical protein C5S48_05325 [Candidatus Methanogaster sp.]|nr:MAG: hypothetical protein C5S48_05325 [ANME-2 cluster archaeon]